MSAAPSSLLLLLVDTRSPAGAHSHSLGMEPAVSAGWVRGIDDLEPFCRGRLRTAGAVAAGVAARAHALAGADAPAADWVALDAEVDARTPSEATRAASRALGRGLRRLTRAMLPALPDQRWWPAGPPHHPVVLGAACAVAGGTVGFAARAAALATCSAPASAAVRLLGLDPYAVQAVLARLAPEVDAVADAAATAPEIPAGSAPALDLLADVHVLSEVRLFAS
ncbi:urease accessory protein UreF [Jatrophihabitans sp. YIM 134969]